MNAKRYKEIKTAYELTINGCGKDCAECELELCVCDEPKTQSDAAIWVKQKEHERVFYYGNREKRLNGAKDYYNKHLKRVRVQLPIVNQATFDLLPDEFTYNDAAAVWGIQKTAAVERIRKFIKKNPDYLTKHRKSSRLSVEIVMRKVKD
jgi:TusA-related sulfurtransferase